MDTEVEKETPAFHKVLEALWAKSLSGKDFEYKGHVKSPAEIVESLKENELRKIDWFCYAQVGHVVSCVESSIAAGKDNAIVAKKDLTHVATIRALEKAGYKISHEGSGAWLISWDVDYTKEPEKKDA